MNDGKPLARDLGAFIDASPSPFHACAEAAARLTRAGFERLEETDRWKGAPGRYLVVRGGSLVAWALDEELEPSRGFHVVGAHTDSPNLRVKPRPDTGQVGYRQLGVEVYGGALWNSWLDRDLSLSGRVFLHGDGVAEPRLFHLDRPLLSIPQLAIHLNRQVNEEGLKLNAQKHLTPIWALADGRERGFRDLLADELDVQPEDILSWDAMCHDLRPATLLGDAEELLAAPRLDNLCSCFCAVTALLSRLDQGGARKIPVVALFDHEEVGSASSRGAQSPLLRDVLERTVIARGGDREDYHRAVAASVCVSADMAHATHPNHVEAHEPDHHLRINGGPVIKINANQRYASEGGTEALFQEACEEADVPYQKWVNRSDLACGSTIGPLTAANLGLATVDVGTAQLAMHSARELAGSADPAFFARALTAFLGG